MPSARVYEMKRALDELTLSWVPFDDDISDDERATFEIALARFRAADADLLDQATRYIWAYYQRERSAFTPAERKAYGIPEIPADDDIWSHVQITLPPTVSAGGHPLQPAASYVAFEGEVPWEPEHGLDIRLGRSVRPGRRGGRVVERSECPSSEVQPIRLGRSVKPEYG